MPTSLPLRLLPTEQFRLGVLLAMLRKQWFIRLRWLFTGGALILLLIERIQFDQVRRPAQLFVMFALLAAANVVWTAVSFVLRRQLGPKGELARPLLRRVILFTNAQILVDVLVLTGILRYSGGIENPSAVFYLFHILIATLLLTRLNSLLVAVWAQLLYTALGVGEWLQLIQPHYHYLSTMADGAIHTQWLYVLTAILILAAGILGTWYFTLHISRRLEAQERALETANLGLLTSQAAIVDLQARRSRFMQTAAHQLKSPIAGIETLCGLIQDGVVSAGQAGGVVERIVNRCRQAKIQVEELLTLARVQEAEPARHHTARTEVGVLARRIAASYEERAREKGIAWGIELEGCSGAYAAVDARDMEDCLGNLLDNAIKYTPEGGSVQIAVSCDPTTVSVCVSDTGIGILEGAEDDIFDPFRRGKLAMANDIPGSGLGLAIVREVVEQAGGRIEVRSAPGEGSEFILHVPRQGMPAGAPAVRGTRNTILRADDGPGGR